MYRFSRAAGATLLALTVYLCFLWSVSSASSLSGCGGDIIEASNLAFEEQVVALINQARAEQALPPLKLNPTLSYAARYLAKDMALDDYFAHDTYDRNNDQLVRVCKWSERIQKYYTHPTAENVATGYQSPSAVVQGWLESQGHRTNILNNYREIGVGYYDTYWVQDFGKATDVYPVIINSEAITTATPDVKLYIYGAWDQIRLRNDEGEWSEWQPFQNEMTWRLRSDPGMRTVEIEVQNNITTVNSLDTIEVVDLSTSQALEGPKLLYLPLLYR